MRLSQSTAGARPPAIGCLAAACLAAAATVGADTARDPPPGLDAAVHASWTRLPLRDWAARVATIAGLPVVVDRRLDPDTTVTLDCRGEPLRGVLDAAGRSLGFAVDELRASVRLVPRDHAGLAAAADAGLPAAVAGLPPAVRRRLTVRAAWAWSDGARPRELVAAAAQAGGVMIDGLDLIPHDHFPAAALPPLPLAERLDLVLAHFDLRVDWRDAAPATGRIVPIGAGLPPRPTVGPRPEGGHQPGRRQVAVTVKDSFSLRLEAPLDQALEAIAKRLGLALDLDVASLRARGIAPGEIVRAEARDVSRDELLRILLGPLGLDWSVADDRLRVFAPEPR